MEGYQHVGSTEFLRRSIAEIRAFARGLSGSGIAADARAIKKSSEKIADSIAELERDSGTLKPRWTGEAASAAFGSLERYATGSYPLSITANGVATNVSSLSGAASSTKTKFGELPDPPKMSGSVIGFDTFEQEYRAQVAQDLKVAYTEPVQDSGAEHPLDASRPPDIGGGDGVGGAGGGAGGSGGGAGGTAGGLGSDPGAGGNGGTGGGAEADDGAAGDAVAGSTGLGDGAGSGTGYGAGGQGTGAAQQPGGQPTSGVGSGNGGGAESPGISPTADGALTDAPLAGDPGSRTGSGLDGGSAVAPLLSPAATMTGGRTGGGFGGGGSGGVAGGGGRSASPLGLRPDAAALRSTQSTVGNGAGTTSGARPSSGGYGMPPAGGAGQRGQGDGRHRVPAYLIDKANGEELVGGMPLVGPGVIGQWRTDGAPEPQAKGGPPPR